MHFQQPTDFLPDIFGGIQHLNATLEMSRIDPEKSNVSHKRIVHELEGQCCERGIIIGCAGLHLTLRRNARDSLHIRGRGEICNDAVQQKLHPFILEGSTTQHRNQLQFDGGSTQCCLDLVIADGMALQIFLQKGFVSFSHRLHQ